MSSISVIIPAYNAAPYLPEALDSVLAQTQPPDEIIVVDDGSTDETAEITRRFAPAVQYVYQPNSGISAARNTGVRAAKGEMLAFLDADDIWLPEKLALQTNALAETGADLIFAQLEQFYSPELDAALLGQVYKPPTVMAGYLASALLVSRASFLKVGWFSEEWRTGEFIDWYARSTEQGLVAAAPPQILLRRRLHITNNSILHQQVSAWEYANILRAAVKRRHSIGKPGEPA